MYYKNFKKLRKELQEIEIEKLDFYVDQEKQKAYSVTILEEILTPSFKIFGNFRFDGDCIYSNGDFESGIDAGFEHDGKTIFIDKYSYIGGVEFENEEYILSDEQEELLFNLIQKKFIF